MRPSSPLPSLSCLASVLLILWAPAPTQAQDTPTRLSPPTTSAPATPTPAPPPAAEARGLSGVPGATDDSAWLAMLVVSGIVAATVLNRQRR